MRSKNLKKVDFLQKTFFQALVEFFLEVLRTCLRYLIGTPSIRLCSRKEIRGAKHVYKKIFTKNRFGPQKNALFWGPDTDIVGKSHDVLQIFLVLFGGRFYASLGMF